MFPKVTTDYKEYYRLCNGKCLGIREYPTPTAKGYYSNSIIWVRQLKPITLFHEFIHHVLHSIGNRDGGTRLFFDLIDDIQDTFYHSIRYKGWRSKRVKWIVKDIIKTSWNDWLDWMLCRS